MAAGLLPAAAALLLFVCLPHLPGFTETVITGGLFRLISAPLGLLTSLLPFSLTEALLLTSPFLLMLVLARFRRSCCLRGKRGAARQLLKGMVWLLSLLLLAYMLLHGLNFSRRPAAELMGLELSPQPVERLQQATAELARRASQEREGLSEDENGCMRLTGGEGWASVEELLSRAGEGYQVLQGEYPFLWGTVNRAKPVMLSHWWSYTGITGMYFPFLAEANVNVDIPASELPATAAHELAHTRGFAREDECNFLACLSCIYSPSADYRYAGYLLAYTLCANALYDCDADRWREASAVCSDRMRRDLARSRSYWQQFEGELQHFSTAVNNGFLEVQGDPDGVRSYDRAVSLILAWYQQRGLPASA